jgi:hypothetical protein
MRIKKELESGKKVKVGNYSLKQFDGELNYSEGEEYIEWFLENNGFSFLREIEIYGLKNDTKSHRRADFYLPKYDVFVEYNGLYNESKEHRERYKEKSQVYRENNLPVIHLYSDNIGALDFYFFERLKDELYKKGKKGKIDSMELKDLLKSYDTLIYSLVFLVIVGGLTFGYFEMETFLAILFMLLLLIVTSETVSFIQDLTRHFKDRWTNRDQ